MQILVGNEFYLNYPRSTDMISICFLNRIQRSYQYFYVHYIVNAHKKTLKILRHISHTENHRGKELIFTISMHFLVGLGNCLEIMQIQGYSNIKMHSKFSNVMLNCFSQCMYKCITVDLYILNVFILNVMNQFILNGSKLFFL